MSDYFLNKIYDSLLSNKPVPEKPKPIVEKKESFKPLAKVYEILVREKVEHVAIYGSREDVDPYNIPQHPNLDTLGVVPKNVVDNIRKEIKKETKFKSEEGEETTVAQILDNILQSKAWSQGFKDYKHVLSRVIQSFTQKEVIFNEIIKYPRFAKQSNNPFREKLLQSPQQVIKINEIIPTWFNDFFEDKQGIDVVNALCDIVFQIGTISVGPGELALTLLSDARKGDKGDLYFDAGNVDVELKGSDGRFGGDGYSHTSTANELNRILNRGENELFNQTSNRLKRDIMTVIDKTIAERTTVKKTEEELAHYNKIKQDIANAKSFEEIATDLQALIDPFIIENSGKSIKIIKGKGPLVENITKILNRIKEYTKHIKKEVKGSFNPALITFFTDYKNLSDQQLIDGIVAARNYEDSHLVQSLKGGVAEILSQEKDSLFSSSDINQNLKCLLAALHGVVYHLHEGITNILFFNKKTKNMILFNYPGETVQQKIKNMYEFFKKSNVTFNLSVDKTFRAIGAEFKI